MDKLIKKILKEETQRYMFFSNLEQMHRQIGLLLDLDESEIESILDNGHDWAQDHIAMYPSPLSVSPFLKPGSRLVITCYSTPSIPLTFRAIHCR